MTHHEGVRVPRLGNPEPVVARVRLVAAAVLLFYVAGHEAPVGFLEPRWVPIVGLLLVGVLVGASVVQLVNPPQLRGMRVPFIAVDGFVTLSLIALYSFDPTNFLFVLAFGVAIEAAFALGLRGAIVTSLAISISYLTVETVAGVILDHDIEPAAIVLRLVILVGIGVLVGSLVEAAQATRAFSTEREKAEHLAEVDEMKTAFLAAVSHDLKNPLTAILGFSTTLEAQIGRAHV